MHWPAVLQHYNTVTFGNHSTFTVKELSNHFCNRISFNHSWRLITETKRPVVRLLEARTLDHTDAKDVENLPEYVVYVFGPITLQPRLLTR